MLNNLKKLLEQFGANRIKFTVLRLPQNYQEGKEYEVDILIRKDFQGEVNQILINAGYNMSQDEAVTHYHYRKGLMHLDITTHLAFGPSRKYHIDGDKVVERSRWEDGLPMPSFEDDFYISLLHALFDKDDLINHESHIRTVGKKVGHARLIEFFANHFETYKPHGTLGMMKQTMRRFDG